AHHGRLDPEDDEELPPDVTRYDRRYVRVNRPVMITSGELVLEDLDLRFDSLSRVYRAPVQLKAMGGALVLDDFGRQRASPAEILSRWIMPLEYGVDYLTLHTGFKFEVPFDCLLVIASNQDPESLADEAFLRRIQYKIRLGDPNREAYEEIFARAAADRGLPYDPGAVDWIFSTIYETRGISPRGCHPRDLLRLVQDLAQYEGRHNATVDEEALSYACNTYFAGTHQFQTI
ncbi:MAG: ATP-binding protein, partial [Gemmatimonadetes bacterium]|nr:ATP-binding protein [Gemmatimonadota bacterium]